MFVWEYPIKYMYIPSPGGSLLRVCGDLDGELHGLLQGVARALVNGLHRLDVDTGDDQVVLWEAEPVSHLAVLIHTKHRRTDDLGRVL